MAVMRVQTTVIAATMAAIQCAGEGSMILCWTRAFRRVEGALFGVGSGATRAGPILTWIGAELVFAATSAGALVLTNPSPT